MGNENVQRNKLKSPSAFEVRTVNNIIDFEYKIFVIDYDTIQILSKRRILFVYTKFLF